MEQRRKTVAGGNLSASTHQRSAPSSSALAFAKSTSAQTAIAFTGVPASFLQSLHHPCPNHQLQQQPPHQQPGTFSNSATWFENDEGISSDDIDEGLFNGDIDEMKKSLLEDPPAEFLINPTGHDLADLNSLSIVASPDDDVSMPNHGSFCAIAIGNVEAGHSVEAQISYNPSTCYRVVCAADSEENVESFPKTATADPSGPHVTCDAPGQPQVPAYASTLSQHPRLTFAAHPFYAVQDGGGTQETRMTREPAFSSSVKHAVPPSTDMATPTKVTLAGKATFFASPPRGHQTSATVRVTPYKKESPFVWKILGPSPKRVAHATKTPPLDASSGAGARNTIQNPTMNQHLHECQMRLFTFNGQHPNPAAMQAHAFHPRCKDRDSKQLRLPDSEGNQLTATEDAARTREIVARMRGSPDFAATNARITRAREREEEPEVICLYRYTDQDVLLGRGPFQRNHIGNKMCQQLIENEDRLKRWKEGCDLSKDKIADEVIASVKQKKGKFLARDAAVMIEYFKPFLAVDEAKMYWYEASPCRSIARVKQKFREVALKSKQEEKRKREEEGQREEGKKAKSSGGLDQGLRRKSSI